MNSSQLFVIIILVLVILASIIVSAINIANYKRELTEAIKKDKEADIERKAFREFIKTVFNPMTAILNDLNGKIIVLSDTIQFVYHKDNPEYQIELTYNGLLGAYNRKNDIPFLICNYEGHEAIVINVMEVKEN